MNTTRNIFYPRRFGVLALGWVLLLSGCLEKRLVWSPDGNHAAVIGKAGLYLCDGEGHLSDLLLPNAKVAAWLPDSQRLVVARERAVRDWATLSPILGARGPVVAQRAAEVLAQLQRGASSGVAMMDLRDRDHAVKLCLRDLHGAEIKPRLSESEWRDWAAIEVSVTDLQLVHLIGDKLVPGPVLHRGLGTITDIRPAPAPVNLVAWTQEWIDHKDDHELCVISLAGGTPAEAVARYVGGYPDWTADGRSLVYIEATKRGEGENDDADVLGVLCRRRVVDAAGALQLAEKPEYLGGLVFNFFTHVRCLRDGRILFNSAEMMLPVAAADVGGEQREQLFALDPDRQSTLVRVVPRRSESELPQALSFFEVSPDERQILIGGMKNEVALLTVATGEVTRIQDGAKTTYQGVPAWRRPGEFTYVKRMSGQKNAQPDRPAEIVLRRGKEETALSASWPTDVLAGVATEDRH